MSLKKAVARLDAAVGTLEVLEQAEVVGSARDMINTMLAGFERLKASIPEARLALLGAALTDVVTAAMVAYGVAYLSPASRRPPAEAVGAELEKCLLPCDKIAGLLQPLATHLAPPATG